VLTVHANHGYQSQHTDFVLVLVLVLGLGLGLVLESE
jgi:hypothetical protein